MKSPPGAKDVERKGTSSSSSSSVWWPSFRRDGTSAPPHSARALWQPTWRKSGGPLYFFFPSAKTLPTTSCSPNVRPTRRAFFFHLPTKSDRYISKLLSASSFFFHGLLDTVVVKTHLPQKVGLGFFFFFNFFLRRKRSASGWAPGIGANAAPRKAGQL